MATDNTVQGRLDDPAFVARATGARMEDVQRYLPGIIKALKERKSTLTLAA